MSWSRSWFIAALLLTPGVMLLAEDPAAPADAPATADDAGLEKFTGDPNDPEELIAYARGQFQKIAGNVSSNPDLAEKQMAALVAMSKEWKIENENSKQIVQQLENASAGLRAQLELARVKVEDLKKKLDSAPDAKSVQQYAMKIGQSLNELAGTDAAAAEKQLAEARDYLKGIGDKTEDVEVKQAIEGTERMFGQVARSIESEKRLAELIGKDAAPLDGTTWVNGEGLTPEQLKGKVVLLDFWAVWCGPCIATFPHLREWYEEYHDKGLEIVGVTGYYNFKWDDAAGKAVGSQDGEVSHEDEQAMLVKFAEQHKLAHPFAINEDGSLSKFYAVTGIPHVVLIDRAGKVRLIKVGAGPATAKQISETLEKLIAE